MNHISEGSRLDTRPLSRTEQVLIKSYEVDSSGKLKLYSLMNFFQEIAGIHATQLGWGYEQLQKKGLFWVLSRIKMYITRVPGWGESASLSTWPVGVDKLFAIRDFQMKDGSGNMLLSAVSAWLLLDRESRRPQKVGSISDPIFQQGVEGNIHPTPGKLQTPEGLELRHEKRIYPSDLDVNEHVNNAEYSKWIVDSLTGGDRVSVTAKSIQVNFLEEALRGDAVAVFQRPLKDRTGVYYLEGVSRNTGSRIFQAEVDLI